MRHPSMQLGAGAVPSALEPEGPDIVDSIIPWMLRIVDTMPKFMPISKQRPVRAAFNVYSRPLLLSGIGTQPSHDGVQ